MKRKLFLMAIAAVSVLVMVACGSKAGGNDNGQEVAVNGSDPEELDNEDVAPKTADGVIAMLRELYDEVNIIYTPRGDDEEEPQIDLFGEFCSDEFNEIRGQVLAIDAKLDDMDKFFVDWNQLFSFWDEAPITPKDFDVDIDGDTATVCYELTHNDESATHVLELVYENGHWRVNDVLQRGIDALNKLDEMRSFIENRQDME